MKITLSSFRPSFFQVAIIQQLVTEIKLMHGSFEGNMFLLTVLGVISYPRTLVPVSIW